MMDGLIFLFNWFQMENTDKFNNPDTPVDELIRVIGDREKKLLAHFGYFVPPYDEELLIMLGYMSMDMGLNKRSLIFFQLSIEYYPSSANAYDSLADNYVAQNDFGNAMRYVSKAFELSGSDYHKERMEVFEEFDAPRSGTVYSDPTTDDLHALFREPGSVLWVAERNGEALLQHAVDSARKLGYTSLYLESLPHFSRALGIYDRMSFTTLAEPLGNSGHISCIIWMLKEL